MTKIVDDMLLNVTRDAEQMLTAFLVLASANDSARIRYAEGKIKEARQLVEAAAKIIAEAGAAAT
jgi:hypothetical protein